MYYLQQLVCALTISAAVVQALPEPKTPPAGKVKSCPVKKTHRRSAIGDLFTANNDLEKRVTEELHRLMDGHNTVYVPMSYVAFMNKADGSFVRYQCDDSKGPIAQTGTQTKEADRQLSTSNLATCIDINLISRAGALKIHVPAHVCPLLPSHEADPQNPPVGENQHIVENFKKAIRLLKYEYDCMGAYTIEVGLGANTRLRNIPTVLRDLFGENDVGDSHKHKISSFQASQGPSTSRIDLSQNPPKFYVQGRDKNVPVP